MPGWLVRSDRVRAFELVADFLRLSARQAPEEFFQQACDLLRRLWEADGVTLWRLDAVQRGLQPLAASAPEWECFGALALEAFPELDRALREAGPLWVAEGAAGRRLLPPPLNEAARLLALPLVAGNRAQGCVFGGFARAASDPTAEELQIGAAVAAALAGRLEQVALRESCEQLERQREGRRRAGSALWRAWSTGSELFRLVAALRELDAAEAAALYERESDKLRQVAAAGAAHWLPTELPLGDARRPWEQALSEARGLTLDPEAWAAALDPGFPQLTGGRFSLRLLPLAAGAGDPPGLLVECGANWQEGSEGEEEGRLLLLLAGEVLAGRRRQRAQQELERRYQVLFDHAAEGVFLLDAGGVLLEANPTLLHWTGYAPGELQGRSLADFLPPPDGELLSGWLRSRKAPGFRRRCRWRQKAGAERELELILPAGEPGDRTPLLGLARDLGREHEGEADLQVGEARLQGLLDSVHDGVWLLDAEGRIAYANHRLSQLFGVRPQQIAAGREQAEAVEELKSHLQAPDQALGQWAHLRVHPDQVCWDEVEFLQPRRRVLERFARPLLDPQHRLVGRLEVYRDITGQRVLEDKVLQREKLASLGQLVSGIAHELNNPLTAVAGYAQLLLAAPLPAELQEKARLIMSEAQRAGRVVQNLLLFAREAKAEKQAVDLADLLERTLSLRAYELKVANLELVREYESGHVGVWADPHQLQQVFLNLLLNAEQAIRSQRDQGSITVRLRRSAADGPVEVEVADDGPGIVPAVLPHIFDPFFTTKPPREGTGLGLSICRAIVMEHGGDIRVESAPGAGATFIVRLPRHRMPASRGLGSAEVSAAPLPPPGKENGWRILVVDDEPAVARLIADALSQQGYEVRAHTESRRALYEAFQEPFHLVICDIRMPDVDGPAFYRALRDRESALAHRLLFTTGDTLARETSDFLEEARLPFLAKPFRVEELRSRVRELLADLDKSSAGHGAALPPPRAARRTGRPKGA